MTRQGHQQTFRHTLFTSRFNPEYFHLIIGLQSEIFSYLWLVSISTEPCHRDVCSFFHFLEFKTFWNNRFHLFEIWQLTNFVINFLLATSTWPPTPQGWTRSPTVSYHGSIERMEKVTMTSVTRNLRTGTTSYSL